MRRCTPSVLVGRCCQLLLLLARSTESAPQRRHISKPDTQPRLDPSKSSTLFTSDTHAAHGPQHSSRTAVTAVTPRRCTGVHPLSRLRVTELRYWYCSARSKEPLDLAAAGVGSS
ncbi:unnamed protein product [Ectocarpus sp. 8 AP-2014]